MCLMRICKIKDCNRKHYGLGLCNKHYLRLRINGNMDLKRNMNPPPICTIIGCNQIYYAKGYCQKHYKRFKKYNDPNDKGIRNHSELCKLEGCNSEYWSKGYCQRHYSRYQRNKNPLYIQKDFLKQHYLSHTPEYRAWQSMKNRCYDIRYPCAITCKTHYQFTRE